MPAEAVAELPGGIHLIGDFSDCRCSPMLLSDARALRCICLELVKASGLTILADRFHQFAPAGVTGFVLLAESHLSIHTWPECAFASVDVFVCNHSGDNRDTARELFAAVQTALEPRARHATSLARVRPHHACGHIAAHAEVAFVSGAAG